ncbi:MAG: branched-chain-amino-acid transaminase [endosymbiont of Galathealinum brachiosum]|uniref:Branched-chain-amino-acid aminotransferase n=1 Tax=endosymbiont of Galathealinum brachiosum TaxID=2200906 RepID=A0A370DGM1_9GAMM|nr:MAG: branched-chain-amino-acid transaminase [endosymbiont of Galathealinum brachiosum]
MNNEIVALEDAKISVMDHGLLYGDGIFEGIRFYNKKAYLLEPHLKRLTASAKALALDLPKSICDLTSTLQNVIDAYKEHQGYIRLIVIRGKGPLGINPALCKKPELIIIASPLNMSDEKAQQNGIRTIISATRRIPADCLDPRIKSLNYLNAILARIEANNAGVEEALMLNQQGFITEGTVDNIFIIMDGELCTTPSIDGSLAGITRDLILKLATESGIKTNIKSLAAYDIYAADECFLTGTGAELIPVSEVDGREYDASPGPVFKQLKELYQMSLMQ